jgi:putative ABC transport system substrate-binding protein
MASTIAGDRAAAVGDRAGAAGRQWAISRSWHRFQWNPDADTLAPEALEAGMRRREFITGLGATAVWPPATRAQQPDGVRRVGVLMGTEKDDPEAKDWLSAFIRGLQELGWSDGRNLRMDVRWATGKVDQMKVFAKELVDLRPDLLLAHSTPVTAALARETSTIPIIFVNVVDPVGSGFVATLARPGGNVTGFSLLEASITGKLLQLLKELVPGTKRVALMFNPDAASAGGSYFFPSFEAAAQTLKVEPIAGQVRSAAEIEMLVTSLGREPGSSGLVVPGDVFVVAHRAQIISLSARNKVPAVYWNPVMVKEGGLLAYGPNFADQFHRAAPYADRILLGAKPADLPVQLPTKSEMTINLRSAKALGIDVPQSIMLRADEVIE